MKKENDIICVLISHGYEAYIIGGYVRDLLLDIESKDIDIVTNAKPDEICEIFPNTKEVGKSFGVVLVDGVEVATYRKDRYAGLSDKNVKISYAETLEEDVSRRDLTINAIALDVIEGRIFDYHNGQDDLEFKTIRFIGKAGDRIFEDPNRILRACRFKALIDGEFHPNTLKALKNSIHLHKHIDTERIHNEILKALKIPKASVFFRACHEIGILKHILPSLNACYGVRQNTPYHTEELFDHAMCVGDLIPCRYPLLKLAGYLHDVGKVFTKEWNPIKKKCTFYEHHKVGADLLRKELRNLRFTNDEIDYICNITYLHMRDDPQGPKGYRRSLKAFTEKHIQYQDWIRIRRADGLGRSPQYKLSYKELKELYRGFRNVITKKEAFNLKDLNIDGNVIMEVLGIKSGKEVGLTLKTLLELVIKLPKLNERRILKHIVELWKEGKELIIDGETYYIKYKKSC